MIIKGKLLVGSNIVSKKFNYQVVKEVFDFQKADCIVVDYLNPDFTILLSNIRFIISERGSVLSHLAIIAREYRKSIIVVEKITSKIPKKGELFLNFVSQKDVEIEIF